ncbi:MAG: hypothetical protein LUE11_00530 [Clostridia bacterium]|nr:hypothetical protein [Clostridia bacterium]
MRLFRLLIWDALFCIVLSVSYSASTALTTSTSQYIITLITCAVCGAFLSQLPPRFDALTFLLVTIPGLYLALAPFLSPYLTPLLSILPLPASFQPVPSILLSPQTEALRCAGALVAGYTLFHGSRK